MTTPTAYRAIIAEFISDVERLCSHGESAPGHRLLLTADVEGLEDTAARARSLLQEPVAEIEPEWVVNNLAELGVKIGSRFFFLYKGRPLEYRQPDEDPMHWRPVFKREFGECCHPINTQDPSMIGTVSLDDSDEWRSLPLPEAEAGS